MPIDSFARDLAAAALQKQGGGGGGGTGDMEKKVYDPTGAVEDKGGIPAYVSGVAKPLTVTLTETSAGSGKYTADKTYDDIKAAYDNHVPIQALVLNGASGDAVLPMMNAEVSGFGAGFTFGYTQLQNDAQTTAMRSIHYFHTTTVDEWTDNDQSAEYLNVNTGGTVLGNINMGQNSITNAQEVHIDGTAPLYLGSTVKAAGTAGVRITGTTNGEAAVVAPDSQSTFRPINVGEPTAQSHAVPKSTVDAALIQYLPLSGGTIIGNVTIQNGVLDMSNSDLNNVAQIVSPDYTGLGRKTYIQPGTNRVTFIASTGSGQTSYAPISIGQGTEVDDAVTLGQILTWENDKWFPELIPGVEYGTVEKFLGFQVYTRLIECGELPDEGISTITMPGSYYVIGLYGFANGVLDYTISLPYRPGDAKDEVKVWTKGKNLFIQTQAGSSFTGMGFRAYVVIKYIKVLP